MFRVVHLTTVHEATDNRIVFKECGSLADAGFHVTLVAYGTAESLPPKVKFVSLGTRPGRVVRLLKSLFPVFRILMRVRPHILHVHDPELIPVGACAAVLSRVRFVYDAHENFVDQVASKPYLGKWASKLVEVFARALMRIAKATASAIVVANPHQVGSSKPALECAVFNFPREIDLLGDDAPAWDQRPLNIGYVGAIGEERGVFGMLDSVLLLNGPKSVRLQLAGPIWPPSLITELEQHPGWKYTDYHGTLNRDDVKKFLCEIRVGLVPHHATPNLAHGYPTKAFEYMAASIPVVGTKGILDLEELIEASSCGLVSRSPNGADLAETIEEVLSAPVRAVEMGTCGRRALEERYSWSSQAMNLCWLYRRLLAGGVPDRGEVH